MRRVWVVELLPFGRCRVVPVDVAGHLVSVGPELVGTHSAVRRWLRKLAQARARGYRRR